MRVAIDTRWIFPEISGIGSHTQELVSHIADLDNSNEYVLLFNDQSVCSRTVDITGVADKKNFSTLLLPYGVFSPRSQISLPRILARERIDVYHSTNYMIPLYAFPRNSVGKIKCVTTIHDVIPLVFPDHAPRSRKTRVYPLYRWLMKEVGKRSDLIITVSNASKRDIIEHLCIPEGSAGKVKTVYNGVSPIFKPSSDKESTSTINHQPLTILYVGRSDPYKNLVNLVEAFKIVTETVPSPVRLTIAGSPDSRYPEAQEAAERLGIANSVNWTGYLSQSDLVSVYQNADILAHPSRYEGFGLQIIEAMACGTPVVCSNAASLPEVAGSAAITLDPDDVKGFADSLTKIITDNTLATELTGKGFEQAAKFTWEKAARETIDLYADISG